MRNIIAITNRKGGVGKTTVAVNLAAALATNFKLNCVLIDASALGSSLFLTNKQYAIGIDNKTKHGVKSRSHKGGCSLLKGSKNLIDSAQNKLSP